MFVALYESLIALDCDFECGEESPSLIHAKESRQNDQPEHSHPIFESDYTFPVEEHDDTDESGVNEAVDEEMDIDFIVILSDAVVDKIAVMVQSVYAFRAVSAVVVPRGLGCLTYCTFCYFLCVIARS